MLKYSYLLGSVILTLLAPLIQTVHIAGDARRVEFEIVPDTIEAGQKARVYWNVPGVERVYITQLGMMAAQGSGEITSLSRTPVNLVYTIDGRVSHETRILTVRGVKGGEGASDQGVFSKPIPGKIKRRTLESVMELIDHVCADWGMYCTQQFESDRLISGDAPRVVNITTEYRKVTVPLTDYGMGVTEVQERFKIRLNQQPVHPGIFAFTVCVAMQTMRRGELGDWRDETDNAHTFQENRRLLESLQSFK